MQIYEELKPTNHKFNCNCCKKPIIKGQKYIVFRTLNDFKTFDVLRFCNNSCMCEYLKNKIEVV